MNKKRILFCGESSHITSGFGVYTKEVISRLSKLDKYDIAEFSSYRTVNTPKTEPWKIYPNAVDPKDDRIKSYLSNKINQFGQWRFDFVLNHFRPDIVIDIRDVWMLSYQQTSVYRPFYHWMIAPTMDAMPQKPDWLNAYFCADTLLSHTNWAKNNLEELYPSIKVSGVVSDSVDTNSFTPISSTKSSHKLTHGLDPNCFVIGSVMRNQKRKLIPDLMIITKSLIKNNPDKKIYLYLHTSYPENAGWDIPSLLLEHNIADSVLLTYKCSNCKRFFPSVFKGAQTYCNICGSKSASIAHVQNGISTKDLSKIYNIFDVYVQYAICEGFGIPQVEAASCGIPVVTVDHGAMMEVGKNIGADLVPVSRIFRELESNTDRVYPNNEICMDIISKYLNIDDLSKMNMAKVIRNKLLNHYSWDKTAKEFESIIDCVELSGLHGKWDTPIRQTFPKTQVKDFPDNRTFVYFVIDKVLDEPHLKKTYFIEDIISSLNNGYINDGAANNKFTKQDALKILEVYMNNKATMEAIRTGSMKNPDFTKDFLSY